MAEIKITFHPGPVPQVHADMPLNDKGLCALMLAKALEGLAGEMAKDTLQLALHLSGGRKPLTKESR